MLSTIYDTEWPSLCWCAVKKLLTHSLTIHQYWRCFYISIDCTKSLSFLLSHKSNAFYRLWHRMAYYVLKLFNHLLTIHFTTDDIADITVAPFVSYIDLPPDRIIFARTCGYLMYIFLFPGSLFCHAMTLLVVYIFCHQFKKLKKHFGLAVGKRGRFNGDLSSFRRRHRK